MQKHYNYLTIDIDKRIFSNLRAIQFDTKSRYILVNLISNNVAYDLSDTTVKIYGVKNDKTIFFNNAVIKNAKEGQFEIELTNQALAVEGQLEIQVLIMGANGEKLTSNSFYIYVGKSIIDENAIESTNEFNTLTEGLKNLAEYDVYRQNVKNNTNKISEHDKKLDEHSSQMETNVNYLLQSDFIKLLNSGTVKKIKLIGDSITEGSSAEGHVTPTTGRVVYQSTMEFDGNTKIYYENSDSSNCYANLFKNYINKNYPSIDFKNWGIGGKSAKWHVNRKTKMIDKDEDVVFIMLGTNDRWDSTSPQRFKDFLLEFVEYAIQNSKLVILMCANPTINEFNSSGGLNSGYYFSMAEVNKVIYDIALNKKIILIDNYKYILNHLNTSKSKLSEYIETNGSHPYDNGHKLIWENMKNELKITDDTLEWLNGKIASNGCISLDDDSILFTDMPTNKDKFPNLRQSYICSITSQNTTISNFPTGASGNLGGQLITYLGTNHLLHYQKFVPRQSEWEFIRYYDNEKGSWTDFVRNSILHMAPVSDYRTGNNVIADFSVGKSIYVVRSDANNGCPSGQGGVLETTRPRTDALTFSYQIFNVIGNVDTYKRWWNGTAWTVWTLM